MAENEKLDLAYPRSGRWRKWRDSILAGKSIAAIANEGVRSLAQTFKNLQKLFEEDNRLPMKQFLMAARGDDGTFHEIMRQAKFGRDYLQLFELQAGQGFDDRTMFENVLTLTIDRVLDQIRHEAIGDGRFPDATTFREFALAVKDDMVGGLLALESQCRLRTDVTAAAVDRSSLPKSQEELLQMSILPDWLRSRLGRPTNPYWKDGPA